MSTIDVRELVEMSRRAREFKHQIGPRIYTLRVPTNHEMYVAYARHSGKGDARVLCMQREITEAAVVDWKGVTLTDLTGGDPADIPFDSKLTPLLFDRNLSDYKELMELVFREYDKRAAALEADSKN